MAFNSKNLHYEKNEPAFLRKLRGEHGNGKQTFQAARPIRQRMVNDEDDSPAMVDEEGITVSKEEYEAMVNETVKDGEEKGASDKNIEENVINEEAEGEREKQKVVDVGLAKKRKQIKVIGGDGENEKDSADQNPKVRKKSKKKVKLSFDDPED